MERSETREETLSRLVDTWQTPLLRTCNACLQDPALAQDAVQETFWKAYRALGSFRGESSEKTWLMHIALNTCRDMQRSGWLRHVDRRVTPEDLPARGAVDEPVEENALMAAVRALPGRLREVTLLYYYQDMTVGEVAETLHLAQSTVSGRLKRARERLRSALEGGGET